MIDENEITPYNISEIPKGIWMVFAPHPDDETFGMGGTLLKAKKENIEVNLVVVTDGAKGGNPQARKLETQSVAKQLNIKETFFLNLSDSELQYNEKNCQTFSKLITKIKPDFIFSPALPTEIHTDHKTTTSILIRAIQLSKIKIELYTYEISNQSQINTLVDISNEITEKLKLINLYKSQQKKNNYLEHIKALNKARTYTLPENITFAEGFFKYTVFNLSNAKQIEKISPIEKKYVNTHYPLVSVLIRTKDRPNSLKQAINSVLTQTYKNIEIVIVNDGGKDVSNIIKDYETDCPITYENLEQNIGPAGAANLALQICFGDYCIFLDDDDFFDSNHIETLIHTINFHDTLAAYSGVRFVDNNNKVVKEILPIYNDILLKFKNYFPIHSVLFSKTLLEKGCKFNENLRLFEDWDFWLQISKFTDFFSTNYTTATYKTTGNSGCNPITYDEKKVYEAAIKIFDKWKYIWTGEDIFLLLNTLNNGITQSNNQNGLQQEISNLNTVIKEQNSEISELYTKIEYMRLQNRLKRVFQNPFRIFQHEKTTKLFEMIINLSYLTIFKKINLKIKEFLAYVKNEKISNLINTNLKHKITEYKKNKPIENHLKIIVFNSSGNNFNSVNSENHDTNSTKTLQKQIEIYKNYGIYGFCFDYESINRKINIEESLTLILNNKNLDIPFCINWKTQTTNDETSVMQEALKIFKDKRYIKINNKPLVMINNKISFVEIQNTINNWKTFFKENNEKLLVVLTHSTNNKNPIETGFDFMIDFNFCNYENTDDSLNYKTLIESSIHSHNNLKYLNFKNLCFNCENKSEINSKLFGNTPNKYKLWLEHISLFTSNNFKHEEQFIFLNNCNQNNNKISLKTIFDYNQLQTTYNVLSSFNSEKLNIIKNTEKNEKISDIAIVIHLFYFDIWNEIKKYLKKINQSFDLHISIPIGLDIKKIKTILSDFPKTKLYLSENRGRDILPFINIFNNIYKENYKYICKIHTKKSPHRIDGNHWRKMLFKGLIGSSDQIEKIIQIFEKTSDIGIILTKGNGLKYSQWKGSNHYEIIKYIKIHKLVTPDDFVFPAGSMFWFRPSALHQLASNTQKDLFPIENGEIDGTLAHAFERIFGLICQVNGYKIKEI